MSKKKTPILSNLFFLLKFIWKINKRIYALNIFKVVLDIAQSLTTVIFLRYIVQYIIIDKNWTLTAIFVGALVVSLGITQILSSVIEPILRKDMDLLEKQILTQVGMTAIKMDYFEMEKPFAKDLLQLAQDPGKFVGVLENVIVSISTFVTIIGLAATILAVDKILIVPLLVAIVLILLSEKLNGRTLLSHHSDEQIMFWGYLKTPYTEKKSALMQFRNGSMTEQKKIVRSI